MTVVSVCAKGKGKARRNRKGQGEARMEGQPGHAARCGAQDQPIRPIIIYRSRTQRHGGDPRVAVLDSLYYTVIVIVYNTVIICSGQRYA